MTDYKDKNLKKRVVGVEWIKRIKKRMPGVGRIKSTKTDGRSTTD